MSKHPYQDIPDHQLWRRSIAEIPFTEVDPVVAGDFKITPEDKIATAGSCFAQHIARHLRDAGLNYFVTETGNPVASAELTERCGYGIFTARYGNLYTARQLLQTIQRAYGVFQPSEDAWAGKDDSIIDPFRPRIQPGGFISNRRIPARQRTALRLNS